MKEERYSISEASRFLDLENHVLRNWEGELGLHIPRNEQGHRYYREQEIQVLSCIKELKNRGFQLKAIKEILPDLEAGCRIEESIPITKLIAAQMELENDVQPGPADEKPDQAQTKETDHDMPDRPGNGSDMGPGKGIETRPGNGMDMGPGNGIETGSGNGVKTVPETGSDMDIHTGSKPDMQKGAEGEIRSKPGNDSRKKSADKKQKKTDKEAQKKNEENNRKKAEAKKQKKAGTAISNTNIKEEKTLPASSFRTREEKMQEFEEIMGRIVGKALREQANEMGAIMGDKVGRRVRSEIDRAMEDQTKRTEEYFKKLDDSIRIHQKARQEAAIAKEEGKRKSRFFRKNKRKI